MPLITTPFSFESRSIASACCDAIVSGSSWSSYAAVSASAFRRLRSARVATVGDRAVADRGDADELVALGQLVDDSISADAERAESVQATAQLVSDQWFAFEEAECVVDRIDQWPGQLKQLASGAPRENYSGHVSAVRAQCSELAAQVAERHRLIAGELHEAGLKRHECRGVREDLRGLLKRLVLIDRNQRRCRPPVARHKNVIATLADVAEQRAQIASKLTYRDRLSHRNSVPDCVHIRSAASESSYRRTLPVTLGLPAPRKKIPGSPAV